MKKVIFIAALSLLTFFTSHAQTEKGTLLLGGDLTFQTAGGSSTFLATPSFGVFAWNNVAIGAQFIIVAQDGFSSWAFGPFARAYFAGSDRGKFYGQFGVNIGGADGSDTEVGFGIGAGYAIFLNRSVAIDLGLSYNKTGEREGIFGIGAGFQIHFKN